MKKSTFFIIFIVLVSIFACNRDTHQLANNTVTQNNVQDWFNDTFKKSKEWEQNPGSSNKLIDWDNGTYLKKDGLEVFEFPLMESNVTIAVPHDESLTEKNANKILGGTLMRLAIIKTKSNEMTVRKLYYVPERNYLVSKGYDISGVMLGKSGDDFTGLLITKDWNDKILSYHRVKNGALDGMLVKQNANTPKSDLSGRIEMDNYATARVTGRIDEENLREVVVYNNYHAPQTYVFLGQQPYFPSYPPSTYNPYAMGDRGGSGGGYSSTPALTTTQTIEKNIDDSQLDPCPKAVFEKLKNASESDIADILKKLGANTAYTVNMVMKPAATYAETQRISKYNYEIRVDRSRHSDGTTLFKATALIHEVIHAYFLSLLDDYNYTPSTALPTFPELFEIYVKKENPTSTEKTDAQHLAMANKYVDAMASALLEYDGNYIINYQVYKDLAWGGLIETPIFDATFPPGSTESIRIKNRYRTESSGHAVEQGTPNQQSPVGKPCN